MNPTEPKVTENATGMLTALCLEPSIRAVLIALAVTCVHAAIAWVKWKVRERSLSNKRPRRSRAPKIDTL